jgi:hypothetical protein
MLVHASLPDQAPQLGPPVLEQGAPAIHSHGRYLAAQEGWSIPCTLGLARTKHAAGWGPPFLKNDDKKASCMILHSNIASSKGSTL